MSTTQRPSVGRIVHWTPNIAPEGVHWAAMVTSVHGGTDDPKDGGLVVTLTVFPPGDAPYPLGIAVSEGAPGERGTWHWPERA